MNKQFTESISRCSICNSYKPDQHVVCHEIPTRTWQSISADLFELNGVNYLGTTDCYSNFFEMDVLKSNTSGGGGGGGIEKLKPHLAGLSSIWQDMDFQTK